MTGTIARDDGAVRELWYTRCGVPTASGIALHQGWLHAEFGRTGIRLNSVRASEDGETRDSHYDHSLPRMFREGGNIPPIWARSLGRNTVVVGITWVDELQAIVTRSDSGVKDIGDLRGRRFGLPLHPGRLADHSRASSLHGLVTTLQLAGLRANDVEQVDIAAPRFDIRENPETGVLSQGDSQEREGSTLGALRQGQVDAIYIKGPQAAGILRDPAFRVVIDLNAHPDPAVHINNAVPRPVTTDRELLEQHPDLVVRYLTVLLRTGHWAKTAPDEVRRLIALETRGTEDQIRVAYGPNLHNSFVPALSDAYVRGLEQQKNFLRDWGFLHQDFDFASWIDARPLAEAERIVGADAWHGLEARVA
jgi:ABC-type nitrate/sulfonate/bicarbonate transport system substrate-binding protein